MRFKLNTPVFLFLVAFLTVGFAEQAMAQFFNFGKNRVQYERFDWRYIQTEHFDIYYYDAKNYHLAQFTAESVEPALKQLSEDFDHTINDRITVIIYDSHSDFSQTNVVALPVDAQGIGGVTDKLKNRMTQPFMGDYIDFRRTLQHELLHAFVNDMFYGGTLQSIVRNNIQLVLPLWFEEGLAEYLALGWDTQTDMYIRDAVINNYLPPLTQLFGFMSYRGGQSFWNWIEETYGRPKITEILQRVRTTRSVELGLRQSLGLSMEEISNRWEESLKQRYLPEVAERRAVTDVGSQISNRSNFGTYNTSPAISPQGDKIAIISNRRGFFDVLVVSAVTGERLKTAIRGEDNPMFEELNILNPNLSWSPDGTKITLSSKSQGSYYLAIVDYETDDLQSIRFPNIDTINSVAWSPDSKKIAFDGNIGPYQDIFVYYLETQEIINLTNDVFSDREPAWGPDSETIYFVSDRGSNLTPGEKLAGFSILQSLDVYETDLYSIRIGSSRIDRLTNTPGWSERQPAVTRDGRMVFISDQNGINNIYEYDLEARVSRPITNLRTGALQLSISSDGTRLAFNSLNNRYLDVFLIRNPFTITQSEDLKPNYWAERRARESITSRVPATLYTQQMLQRSTGGNVLAVRTAEAPPAEEDDQTVVLPPETGQIDFRNYVFGDTVTRDTTITLRDDPRKFEPLNNVTTDGLYQPKEYRLTFSPDFSYAAGTIDTYYGGGAFAMFTLSDLFGDHQLAFGTNLVFDLRESDYVLQYGYLKNRTNFFASFFHQARSYQTFFGDLLRFRTYGLGAEFQYPLNRFQRIDYGMNFIGISRDLSSIQGIGEESLDNDTNSFLYPQVTFTGDFTVPGFLTPSSGSRYSIQLSGSSGVGINAPQFVSLLGDYRKYLNLGPRYSIALRGSSAASFGPDSQTYFMGGMLGWINQRWSQNEIPLERLADTFFTLPATPVRGHEYNTIYGDKFSLVNVEFRFPLFAAVLPGPIPLFPLYNITGVAFFDAGAAWGKEINYSVARDGLTGERIVYWQKPAELEFRVAQREEVIIDQTTGLIKDGEGVPGDRIASYVDGDILLGAGFGLRTIFLGLPLRWDVGWPYMRDGFRSKPIHYISIGIDF